MAVSASYKTFVLEQLEALGTITAKPMFGGVGLYHAGVFFGLMADDTVFFKVDDSNRADFERAGSRPFRPYGEDMYAMSYYELPADVLESRPVLCQWAEKAVAVARRSATAKGR